MCTNLLSLLVLLVSVCCCITYPYAPIDTWFSGSVNQSSLHFTIEVPDNYTSVRLKIVNPTSTQQISVYIQELGLYINLYGLYSYGLGTVSTGSTLPGTISMGNYTLAIIAFKPLNFTMFISLDDVRLPSNATYDLRWTSSCHDNIDSMYLSGAVMTIDNRAHNEPISIFFYPSTHRDPSDPYQPYASDAAIVVYISLDKYPDPLHRIYDAMVTSDTTGLLYTQISGQSVPALENGTYNVIMTEKVANLNCSTIRYYYVGYCRGQGCSVVSSGYNFYTN